MVNASVGTPEIVQGTTRQVCTGWTGSGSVPASGTSTEFPFAMSRATSIDWQWRTDYWIDVSVVSGGTTDFRPRWVESGKTIEIELRPATHLFTVSLSGDTSGATVSGNKLRVTADQARRIVVTIAEIHLSFSVSSEQGTPLPSNGTHVQSWGDQIIASVVPPPPENGFHYICTGWRGTGSAPASGEDEVTVFTIEKNSSVTWLWRTNVWISLSANGAAAVDSDGMWIERGGTAVFRFEPLADFVEHRLSGDADGVLIDPAAGTITIPADRPRSVSLFAEPLSLASALDAKGLVWTTGPSGAEWIPQTAVTDDGEDAARSGPSTSGDSILETKVTGPGTFAWSWKFDSDGWAGVDASVDGHDVA
jgi:hypothetical protein